MKNEITFVIPALNVERTILKCLQSIKDSAGENAEIIVIDNGNTDRTNEIVIKAGVKLVQEPKRGRSNARNKGLAFVKTDYVAFIDADCTIAKNWTEEVLKYLRVPHVGGIQTQIIPGSPLGTKLCQFRYDNAFSSTNGNFLNISVIGQGMPFLNSAACAYKTKTMKEVNGFDPNLKREEDADLAKRVCYSGKTVGGITTTVAQCDWQFHGWPGYIFRYYRQGYCWKNYWTKWENSRPIDVLKSQFQFMIFTCYNVFKRRNFFWSVRLLINSAYSIGLLHAYFLYIFQRHFIIPFNTPYAENILKGLSLKTNNIGGFVFFEDTLIYLEEKTQTIGLFNGISFMDLNYIFDGETQEGITLDYNEFKESLKQLGFKIY